MEAKRVDKPYKAYEIRNDLSGRPLMVAQFDTEDAGMLWIKHCGRNYGQVVLVKGECVGGF